ncbi:hypothetical protein [Maribacter sp. ACAM166]|uniref:hypothetical protein n=1 Tax=Maribacter sp. ACAM166 TaxID=2508996 RepID=UPI0010FEF58D|nr:hypothetical protein [Maribacter sp. ACAM166]TLP75695.1 hypothetical protein ES765_14740 [Maribacter sp. ACAM166]
MTSSLSAQDYFKLNEEVQIIPDGNPIIYSDANSYTKAECRINYKQEITLLGFKNDRWYFETENCKGFIRDMHIAQKQKVKEQKDLVLLQQNEQELVAEKEKEKEKEIQRIKEKSECQYVTNEIDKFDNIQKRLTKSYLISTELDDLRIALGNYDGKKIFSIGSIHDLGCTSPLSNDVSFAKIKLENGEIVIIRHNGDLDCGSFGLDGVISSSNYNKLISSPIQLIRLQGTDGYHDYDYFTYKEVLVDKLKCIN